MSSLWYANSVGGRRGRRHMGPFLITDVERPTVSTATPTTQRQRVASVPAPSQRQQSAIQSIMSDPKAASDKCTNFLRETIVPPPPEAAPPDNIPTTPIRRLRRSSKRRPVGFRPTTEKPNRIAAYSAPCVQMSVSTVPKGNKTYCTMIPSDQQTEQNPGKVSVIDHHLPSKLTEDTTKTLKPKFAIERHPSKDFSIQRKEEKQYDIKLENIDDSNANELSVKQQSAKEVKRETPETLAGNAFKTTVLVAVEPPTSTSVTASSTVNSLDQLCEKDAMESSPLFRSKSTRKNGLSGFRFFRRHSTVVGEDLLKKEVITNAPIVMPEKYEGEHASTSTGTFSEERSSLLSTSANSQPLKLKRYLHGAIRRLSRTENMVLKKQKKPTGKNVTMKFHGTTTVNLDADKSNRDISLTQLHPKSSSSTELSFSRQNSSIASYCTPPHGQSAPPTQQRLESVRYKERVNPIGPESQFPALSFPPPFYYSPYAKSFPSFQYLNHSHSPTYYTTSRKAKKTSRMTQGPQRYFFFSDIVLDFCARTSSHGIPFIGTHSFFGRVIWSIITILAFLAFCIQTYFTLYDYLHYRTIIEMQLKFEPAPFPAATLCNLNSFKYSELRKFEEIGHGFKLWEEAIFKLDRDARNRSSRVRRQISYRPVYARCVCTRPGDQCVPQRNELDTEASVCICFEDAQTGDIWPCYADTDWTKRTCFHCSNVGTCEHPDKLKSNETTLSIEDIYQSDPRFCICQSVSHYCLARNLDDEIRWWNPYNYTVFPATEPPTTSPEIAEAFGLDNLHDRGAITTRTKENLIFMVAAMPREIRRQLSYTLNEFVLRCSFNSKDCDLERDFQIQIDPEYGNCYTFNFNDSVELKNSRAGPMYGLRLLLNVNQSDYMPTTEAAGVRLVVHEQDQEPFPDTFGYSAPTGFVSSFGLKTKVLNRLDAPYGKCSDTFRPEGYIYAEHYSPEGCYRNCFQQIIIKRCGCGDPRFPMPLEGDVKPCDARAAAERACLANETSVLGGFHHLTHDCHCVQPCTENVFETAYSAAAWPAINFKIGEDCAGVLGDGNFTEEECIEYYRRNTAYIEIYYEQLNFEYLKETAGYTMVNLFSDLGGNIGLWIGFSLITVFEFIEFFCECITFGLRSCVVQRLFGRRASSRCSGSRSESVRNGRTDANAADNFSAISALADSSVEIGQSAAAAALDDEHFTPRRSSTAEDKKTSVFYYHYDPRRNTAASKQWRRRIWEMQQRQWEEWRRQQEELTMQQQATEESASVDKGTILPSLAAATFSMFEMPKLSQGASFGFRVDKVAKENDEIIPTNAYQADSNEKSPRVSTSSQPLISAPKSIDTVIISGDRSTAFQPRCHEIMTPIATFSELRNDYGNNTTALKTSESINLMRFESIDNEPFSSLEKPRSPSENKSISEMSLKQSHTEIEQRTAPQKPPMSESLRASFKKENLK